jgi:steroid delta-isomerase-like uncharacterized protein
LQKLGTGENRTLWYANSSNENIMLTADNKNVIRRFVEEVLNEGRFERLEELVLEDFVELDPLPGQSHGREGLREVIRQMRISFPDMYWVVDEMIGEADKVCTRFTWTGTQRGPFLGVPATGRHITVKGVVIDRLSAGKMADSRILMDTLGIMQQLGVVPGAGRMADERG